VAISDDHAGARLLAWTIVMLKNKIIKEINIELSKISNGFLE